MGVFNILTVLDLVILACILSIITVALESVADGVSEIVTFVWEKIRNSKDHTTCKTNHFTLRSAPGTTHQWPQAKAGSSRPSKPVRHHSSSDHARRCLKRTRALQNALRTQNNQHQEEVEKLKLDQAAVKAQVDQLAAQLAELLGARDTSSRTPSPGDGEDDDSDEPSDTTGTSPHQSEPAQQDDTAPDSGHDAQQEESSTVIVSEPAQEDVVAAEPENDAHEEQSPTTLKSEFQSQQNDAQQTQSLVDDVTDSNTSGDKEASAQQLVVEESLLEPGHNEQQTKSPDAAVLEHDTSGDEEKSAEPTVVEEDVGEAEHDAEQTRLLVDDVTNKGTSGDHEESAQQPAVEEVIFEPLQILPATKDLKEGIIRAGHTELGDGGFGIVKEWHGKMIGGRREKMAVKMLKVDTLTREQLEDEDELKAWKRTYQDEFRHEAEYLEKFKDSPWILNCFGLEEHPDGFNMSLKLERLDGSVASLTKAKPLSMKGGFKFLEQTSEALIHLRSHHLCHFDLKTDNVGFVDDPKLGLQFKLMDFGQITPFGEESRGGGTPLFRAPEIAEGKACNEKSDVYSLFITLLDACHVGWWLNRTQVGGQWEHISEEQYFENLASLEAHDDRLQDWADMISFDAESRPSILEVKARLDFLKKYLSPVHQVVGRVDHARAARYRSLATAIRKARQVDANLEYETVLGPMARHVALHLEILDTQDELEGRMPYLRFESRLAAMDGPWPTLIPNTVPLLAKLLEDAQDE